MHEQLNWFTVLLNKYLGALALKVLAIFHVTPADPHVPIPNFVAASLLVCIIASLFFLWLRPRISAGRPGATQQVMELLLTNSMGVGIRDLLDENIEHGARRYLPVVGAMSIFILLSNAISIFPGFLSPTGHPSVPLACAIVTFVYYNFVGVKSLGPLNYAKHFAGPIPWLSWLIFPVEILSHSARLLSLTVRLWANIFASELIYVIFLGLCMSQREAILKVHPSLAVPLAIFPAIIPVAFILLHLFVAVIQAFVFTILPAVYIGMATAEEH
jgi:F-type H+-transporting ATPase subunit a